MNISLEPDDIAALSEGTIPAWLREACDVRLDAIDTVAPAEADRRMNNTDNATCSDERYRQMARHLHGSDGDIEIDNDANVSRGNDPGAYVHAWVWVPSNVPHGHRVVSTVRGDDHPCNDAPVASACPERANGAQT